MIKEISLKLEEGIIAEFEELHGFWIIDEENNLIKPSLQEILRKFIIDNINERRIEIAASQAAIDTIKLEDSDIIINTEK